MNKKAPSSKRLPIVIAAIASVLLLASLKLPLWHMRLEAPQYREQEALKIATESFVQRGHFPELFAASAVFCPRKGATNMWGAHDDEWLVSFDLLGLDNPPTSSCRVNCRTRETEWVPSF